MNERERIFVSGRVAYGALDEQKGGFSMAATDTAGNENGSSLYAGYVNLINSIVGSGILGLPIAFANTGWILGYVLIVFAAAATSFSLNLLTCCAKKVPHPASFDSVTEAAFPGYGYVVDLVVGCLCFGNATSYLIVLSKLMPEVTYFFGAAAIWQSRHLWVCVGVLVVGPLSYLKSLDALEFTNSLGLASTLFITAIIVAYSMHFFGLDPCADDPLQCVLASTDNLLLTGSTISYLGVFVFAYTCQMNLFPMVNEMASPTVERCNKVIGSALFTAMVLYALVAGAGYYSYGDLVESNILVNYPFTRLTSATRIAVSLLVICSYPLQCVPSRNCALSLWKRWAKEDRVSEDTEWRRHYFFTTLFVLLSFCIALAVSDLGIVIALLGATGSTTINYILPGAVYWRLHEAEEAAGAPSASPAGALKRHCAGGMFLLGCAIMPVCVSFLFMR